MSATLNGRGYVVRWDDTKNPPKPVLPDVPEDDAGYGQWTTAVLNLSRRYPVIGGEHQGPPDGTGHVKLTRLDAPEIRFEPASILSNASKLGDALLYQTIIGDGALYPWTNGQAKTIAWVVRQLCGNVKTRNARQDTAALVATYLDVSTVAEGSTHLGTQERYEALVELRPKLGASRYLIDADTGEFVIRVSDLAATARKIYGGSLERGWLDARMDDLGWPRRTVQGHAETGRDGRRAGHARADVYRGFWPPPSLAAEAADEAETGVNT